MTDTLDPTVTAALDGGFNIGDLDDDGNLDVNETWTFSASYTVTQADIDAGGNFDGPDVDTAFNQLRNVATADSDQTEPESDDATVPVEQAADLSIVKVVQDVARRHHRSGGGCGRRRDQLQDHGR